MEIGRHLGVLVFGALITALFFVLMQWFILNEWTIPTLILFYLVSYVVGRQLFWKHLT
jgi:hypothetical protein